jgi:hypothetical protein
MIELKKAGEKPQIDFALNFAALIFAPESWQSGRLRQS